MKAKQRVLLLVSHLQDDVDFAKIFSEQAQLTFLCADDREQVRQILVKNPDTLVLWNAEAPKGYGSIFEVLAKHCQSVNLFAITSKALKNYPELIQQPIFGHHLLRNYEGDGFETYFKLIEAAANPAAFAFKNFFSESVKIRSLALKNSGHKKLVADAMQKHLTEIGFMGRVAATVTQAIDELSMNAVFDAPVDSSGGKYRWNTPRTDLFELNKREQVSVEIAMDNTYSGVCVTDHFGSMTRGVFNEAISKHFHRATFSKQVSALERGMGLRGIVNARLSLLNYVEPGKLTRAMIFFPHSGTFKDFRRCCQFISLLIN